MEFDCSDIDCSVHVAHSWIGITRYSLPASDAVLCTPEVYFTLQKCHLQYDRAEKARCDNRCFYRTYMIQQLRRVFTWPGCEYVRSYSDPSSLLQLRAQTMLKDCTSSHA